VRFVPQRVGGNYFVVQEVAAVAVFDSAAIG
jgi:hypothetical protein